MNGSARLDRVVAMPRKTLPTEETSVQGAVSREDAMAALGTLLDIISELRSLGREENGVLAGAIATATKLGAASAWLRSLAHLTALTGALWTSRTGVGRGAGQTSAPCMQRLSSCWS